MKTFLPLVACFALMTFVSCKKDTDVQSKNYQFIDTAFSIYDFRPPGDTIPIETTVPNTLILKSDATWTLDFGGAISNGTYSLKWTSAQQGDVKFAVLHWTDYTTNLIISDKLRLAILAVKHYGLSEPEYNNFDDFYYPGSYFPFIRTEKK